MNKFVALTLVFVPLAAAAQLVIACIVNWFDDASFNYFSHIALIIVGLIGAFIIGQEMLKSIDRNKS